jgi:transcriptional regulator with XRE-family HTH domain
MNVGSIGEYIRQQREQAKISLRQLASAAGVSNPYLSQIERGLRRPSAEILQQIAKGLRISAEALYVQAGILEDREPDSDVRAAVLAAPDLTERQKQVLLEIYESFRQEMSVTAEVISVRGRAVSESVPTGGAKDSEGTPDSAGAAAGTGMPGKNGVRSKPATPGKVGARSGTGAGKTRTRTRASAGTRTRASAASGTGAPGKARTVPEDGNPGKAGAAPGTAS